MWQWMQQHQVLAVALVIAALLALWYLRFVFVVILIGYIIAASILPLIDWLAHRVPRGLAIALVYLAFFGVLFGILAPAALALANEWQGLARVLGDSLARLMNGDSPLARFGIEPQAIMALVQGSLIPLTTTIIAAFAAFVTAIVMSIYLLLDWHDRHRDLRDRRGAWHTYAVILTESEQVLGSWARGELLLGVSIGVLSFIALTILGIPFALPLAALAGICELIPYAGPILGAVPAVLLGLDASLTQAMFVTLAYVIIQQIENHLLVPLIMKNALAMHPVIIIASLLAGFEIMGIAGALVAVPLASVLRIALKHLA